MTDLEKQIIELITTNRHLSEELKKRYILAMFLMESAKQDEYLRLLQSFTWRCKQTDRGIFIVKPNLIVSNNSSPSPSGKFTSVMTRE